MTDKEIRFQIYEYITNKGIDLNKENREPLTKLLKTYGKAEQVKAYRQLKARLTSAIEVGETKIAENDPAKFGYQQQLIALQSILKWTEGQLKHL